MFSIRKKLLLGLLIIFLIGIITYVIVYLRSSADVTQGDRIDLVVYPENWKVERYTSGMNMIAVKGKNGFSGEVKLSVSGIPFGIYDNDSDPSDYYYCSSHCQASSNGDFPFTFNVKEGEWTSIGPTLGFISDLSGSYTITVKAEGGGTSVEKKFTLNLVKYNGADPQLYPSYNQVEFRNTQNKISLKAGESTTVTFDVYNRNSAVSGTLESNLGNNGLKEITNKITGGFEQTSFSLNAKSRQSVQMQINTASDTPSGIYEITAAGKQNNGSLLATVGVSLVVSGTSGTPPTSSPDKEDKPSTPDTSPDASDSTTPTPGTPSSGSAGSTSSTGKAKLEVSLNELEMEAINDVLIEEKAFEVKNEGEDNSILNYQISDDAPWLFVDSDRGEVKKGENKSIKVLADPGVVGAGEHSAKITVKNKNNSSESKDISVKLSKKTFAMGMIETDLDFGSQITVGFWNKWDLSIKNIGDETVVAGVAFTVPDEYEYKTLEFPSNYDLIYQEDRTYYFTVKLNPKESSLSNIDVKVPREYVVFPGETESDVKRLKDKQVLNQLFINLFATLSVEKWNSLKNSYSSFDLVKKAGEETFKYTAGKIDFLDNYQDKNLEIVTNLSSHVPELAEAIVNYFNSAKVIDSIENNESNTSQGLLENVLRSIAKNYQIKKAEAFDRDALKDFAWCSSGVGYLDPYCQNLIFNTATSTLEGFADGRNADAIWGLDVGVMEVITFGLWKPPPFYGSEREYQVGRTTGIIAGTAEMTLLPAAYQAGPKAAITIARNAAGEEFHLGLELVSKGGRIWKNGENVNLLHVGYSKKWGGGHIAAYGAGKPVTLQSGKVVIGAGPHVYTGKLAFPNPLSSRLGPRMIEIPHAYLAPLLNSNRQFSHDILHHHPNFNIFFIPQLRYSYDPNQITSDPSSGYIKKNQTLNLRIDFENLASASVNATNVKIEFPVDPGLDIDSYQFSTSSQNDLIKEDIDRERGLITWTFENINLPPNNDEGVGTGFVEFSILPKTDVVNETIIKHKASIVFDFNPAIETNEIEHIIDSEAPKSEITKTKITSKLTKAGITIDWQAEDPGEKSSGVDYTTVMIGQGDKIQMVGTNSSTSPTKVEVKPGKKYRLYIISADKAGNMEQFDPNKYVEVKVPWYKSILIQAGIGLGILVLVFIFLFIQKKRKIASNYI